VGYPSAGSLLARPPLGSPSLPRLTPLTLPPRGRVRRWSPGPDVCLRWCPGSRHPASAFLRVSTHWLQRSIQGGTKDNPSRVGFSLVDNYWCDLLDATTYGGRPNPSRPFALAAMIALCAGLSVLWWTVPALFQDARRRRRFVRYAGFASAVVTPLVGTPLHDWAIDAAGLLGVAAFGVTMSAIVTMSEDRRAFLRR
jgi:hypothetical protein